MMRSAGVVLLVIALAGCDDGQAAGSRTDDGSAVSAADGGDTGVDAGAFGGCGYEIVAHSACPNDPEKFWNCRTETHGYVSRCFGVDWTGHHIWCDEAPGTRVAPDDMTRICNAPPAGP